MPDRARCQTPIACTLDAEALPDRLGQWRHLLATAGERSAIDGGARIELPGDTDVAFLTELVVAEQRCCAFFSFAITIDGRGLGLEVRAPADAAQIVEELFRSSRPN